MGITTSPTRIRAARVLAVVADAVQWGLMPLFLEGLLSPANDVLDVVIGIAMVWLVGWHWAFLPAFVSELVPLWALAPTWTIAVMIATRGLGEAEDPKAVPVVMPPKGLPAPKNR